MNKSYIKKQKLLLIGFCFITISIIAQTSKDTLIAAQYYKKADSLLTIRKHDKSIAFFKKAILIYKKEGSWRRVADCYNRLSDTYRSIIKLQQSFEYIEKALSICDTYLIDDNQQRADAYHNKGDYYRLIRNYDKALQYYNNALTIRQKILPKDDLDIAQSYNCIGATYNDKEKLKIAITYFEKAIKINVLHKNDKDIASIYNNIGTVYAKRGKLNLAIDYFKKSLEIKKKVGANLVSIGRSYNNIGMMKVELNQYDEGLTYFLKALPILKNNYEQISLSYTYEFIGILYFYKGENDKALQYFNKSLNLRLEYYGESHPLLSYNYSNIANTHAINDDFEKAMYFYEKALHISIKAYGENHHYVSSLYDSMGQYLVLEGKYDIAMQYHKKSLEIHLNIYKEKNPIIAKSYRSIASVYNKNKSYEDALFFYQKGLVLMQNAYGSQHLLTANYYHNIGIVYQEQKDYISAINYFNDALIANNKNKNTLISTKNFDPNHYFDLKLLLETLEGKAKTLQSQYQKTNNRNDLDQSIALYENANTLILHLRQSFQNYQDKIALAKQTKEIYNDAIAAQLLLYNETGNKQALENAFNYSEKSKANVLKDILATNNINNFSTLPVKFITLEKKLKSNRAFYQSQIITEQSKDSINTGKVKDFENELFAISQREDSLLQVLKKNHPKYYQLQHKKESLTITDIQKKLDKQTTLLQFFTNDSITYAFTISKDNIAIKTLIIHNLDKKIRTLNKTIVSENMDSYKKLSHNLYKSLISPIQSNLVGDKLIIIPDGSLWHLNFDLLLTKNTGTNARDLYYLLKNYAISYANSANLFFNPLENNRNPIELKNECLAFSFMDTINPIKAKTMRLAALRDTGDDLPGTRKEIKAISKIFDGQYYYGSEAIEANFKQNANKYKIIHLALHGEVDDENPQRSKLYFTKNKDSIEDNLLYSHELFALNIPAELTVLSACNTGMGKIANGEGIMSLGNAFQYAGTKSLLLSSWEVSDKTTPDLMKYFYANLKKGMNKAQALQQAKLKYLDTAEAFYTNPFYWGSFYIIGNTDKIVMEQSLHVIYYYVISIIICLLLIYLVKTKLVHKKL